MSEDKQKDDKHTKEFERIMTNGITEPTFAQAENFVLRLSEKLSEQVIAKMVAGTAKSYVTNKEIYMYCKKNGIETDHDPYDNYEQSKIDFKKPVDYSSYSAMDDITVEGRTGFVLTNDPENKKMVVEFDDNDETKTIEYGE